MKKICKLFALLSVFLLVLFVAACGDDNETAEEPDETYVEADPDEDGDAEPEPEPEPEPEVEDEEDDEPAIAIVDDEEVTLTYVNWNLGGEGYDNIERRMVAAFMDRYPHIRIEFIEGFLPSEETSWVEHLAIAASTGDLPDVFMVHDIGVMLANGWVYDLTDIANANNEFMDLPQATRDITIVNGSVYSVPFAQHMMGFFVNQDLFDSLNLDAPTYGFSIDDLTDALSQITDLNAPTIGTSHFDNFTEWYPATVNSDMGFFTFDGESFHLDSDEMREGVALATELMASDVAFDALDEDIRGTFNGGWGGEVFFNGQMGLLWDGTWASGNIADQSDFAWDFIGIPGGRPLVTMDILAVAATSEHPEEAYLFAKWMGFGSDGFEMRMQIAEEMGEVINTIPLTTDQAVLDQFFDILGVDGIVEAHGRLDEAVIDFNKFVPGWTNARFYGATEVAIGDNDNATIGDFMWNTIRGYVNFNDYAARLNEVAQEAFDAATAEIE